MAYGLQYGGDIVFPALMGTREIDSQAAARSAMTIRRFQPIAVIRACDSALADRMAELWATPAFDELVRSLFEGERGRPRGVPLELLNAILALEAHHNAHGHAPGSIGVWVADGFPDVR